MNIRPTHYKAWCLRISRPACNSAQCYDAIMSAHVLMMALFKSGKIQVCLKAWSLAATSRTPPYPRLVKLWHEAKETAFLSVVGGEGHLGWMFTSSFKINMPFIIIIMKTKQPWTYWSDFLRTLTVKTPWLSKFNSTSWWQMVRDDTIFNGCKGNGKIFVSLHWHK